MSSKINYKTYFIEYDFGITNLVYIQILENFGIAWCELKNYHASNL